MNWISTSPKIYKLLMSTDNLHQTYLKDCDCKNGGIIIYNGKPYCRWCRTPYGEGGSMFYEPELFKASTQQTMTTDNFKWTDELREEFNQHISDVYYNWIKLWRKGDKLPDVIKHLEHFKASKQQSKDWEIVEVKTIEGRIFKWKDYSAYESEKYEWIKTGEVTIYSVRRLSDGEVFTVRDRYFNNTCNIYTEDAIEKFIIEDSEMHVYGVERNGFYCIKDIEKKKRKPLFTTHDNVEIYEGDEYWNVDKENENDKLNWLIWNGIAGSNEFNLPKHNPYKIYFSTESAAKEWVSLFKKNYSKNSICEIFNIDKNDSRWHKVKD